jgi:hypothetical protein
VALAGAAAFVMETAAWPAAAPAMAS